MAAIGSAIGLGNFWRFPYLCFKWGGGLFFIPYLLSLFLLGLPMMLLELSLGQLFQRGDIGVFSGIKPELYGVGLASVFSAFAINIFYTYLIAIACVYFVVSIINTPLPWSLQKTKGFQDLYCMEKINEKGISSMWRIDNNSIACPKLQSCKPSEMYITEE
jgi:SNF family Na+-dependent transporter